MNEQLDDREPKKLQQEDVDKYDKEQSDKEQSNIEFKPRPVLFAFTIGATLVSFFCYLVLDLRLPAILIVVIVAFVNYIITKREYDDELKNIDEKESEQNSNNDEEH